MMQARKFPGTADSVGAARRFVAAATDPLAGDVAETVALMVSELATNSVQHADTAFVVGVEHAEGVLRVEVSDESPGEPLVRSPAPSQTTGRGLWIVAALADSWGVTDAGAGSGKTVWFTLTAGPRPSPVERAAAPGLTRDVADRQPTLKQLI